MWVSNSAVALFAGLALTACVANGAEQSGSGTMPKTTYQCPDGSLVEASFPTTDTAKIVYQGRSIEMTSAVSASGARYVGGGWQWWSKGATEGLLSPLAKGKSIASAKGMTCTAP